MNGKRVYEFKILTPVLRSKSKRAVEALQGHIKDDLNNSSNQQIYLIIETKLPTARRKEVVPRIIPLINRVSKVSDSKILLVTKNPITTYKSPLTKKGSATEDTFDTIISFRKFRQLIMNKKEANKLYHNNNFILVDHRLNKLLYPLLHNTVFEKTSKKYPLMLQMARPSADAHLIKSKKSQKMKDERVDPEYVQKQVQIICGSTTFVPSTGNCLSVIIGNTRMTVQGLIKNIDCVLNYLMSSKFKPVGGVINSGMDGITGLNVKLAESVTIPILTDGIDK